MAVKISQEQLELLNERESNYYINRLHEVIVKNSPTLSRDENLKFRLEEAERFVNENAFVNKNVKTEFLIMNAYEPDFYKKKEMQEWLLGGNESAECEYIKYQQIRANILKRSPGVIHE